MGRNCVEPSFWTSWKEAPRLERSADKRTLVSITTRTTARVTGLYFGARLEADQTAGCQFAAFEDGLRVS